MAARRSKAEPMKSAARQSKKRPRPKRNMQPADGPRAPSPIRGLLPTTPEIERMLDEMLKDRPATEVARRYQANHLKCSYYFGGQWIAYRETDEGIEVLAVGDDEIGRLKRKLARRGESDQVVLGYCDPW